MDVKDIDIELMTDENGHARHVTDNINGKFCAFLFDSEHTVHLQISLEAHQDIILYENISISGVRLIPLKIEAQASGDEKFNFTQSDIYLNDKLNIEVLGMKNTKVKLKLRYI